MYSLALVCNQNIAKELMEKDGGEIYDGFFIKQLRSFTRFDVLEQQSICNNRKSSVELYETINEHGLCFTMNYDANLLNREM